MSIEAMKQEIVQAIRAAILRSKLNNIRTAPKDGQTIGDLAVRVENLELLCEGIEGESYDQTALELCEECGWRAMIPGDGCLVCARQKPVAWMFDFLADDRDEIIRDWTTQEYAEIEREKGFNVRPLYTAPAAPKPLRWVDTIIPGDRVIDNDDKTQARVSKLIRQRPAAPDYFKLEFDDGSYIDVTDNEMIANYKPLPESRKPVAYADSRIHGWPDCFVMEPDPPHTIPLYTAPREWVGLTDEDLSVCDEDGVILARYWESKLKEKNSAG